MIFEPYDEDEKDEKEEAAPVATAPRAIRRFVMRGSELVEVTTARKGETRAG